MSNIQLPENIEEIKKFAEEIGIDVKYLLGEKWEGNLPENIKFNVGGSSDLSSVESLPNNIQFNVGGWLDLPRVKSLPENIKFNVGGSLDLDSVESLPANIVFNVGGHLYLRSVQSLPDNVVFNVGGDYVDLRHVKSLPANIVFNVGGDLYLSSNKSVPDIKQQTNEIKTENKKEFKFGEFIKKHPKISLAIGLVVILASVILTMYSTHPIAMWLWFFLGGIILMLFFMALSESENQMGSGIMAFVLFFPSALWVITTGLSLQEDESFKSYMFERHYDTITKSDTVIVSKRISCTQVQNDAERIVTDSIFNDYKQYSLFSPNVVYTKDTIVNSYTIKGSSRLTNDTLHIENLTCGDTLTNVDKKPYEDKNFSLIRTRKTFIDSNWELTTDTSYTNKSPNIKDWELNKIFNDVPAEWSYDRYVNKYVIRMIDENKTDTLDTENLALELLNNKCKDKSTIAGKLVYAEYDACKSNNSVRMVMVNRRSVCGHSDVKLNYNLGTVATAPYYCSGESNLEWSY